jgi:hypothetical protein
LTPPYISFPARNKTMERSAIMKRKLTISQERRKIVQVPFENAVC